jgi:adenine/guanine phosphoribosyltransferase-like PRPP-binding protein
MNIENIHELPPDIELATIRAKEMYLMGAFKRIAKLTDYDKGYISAPFVNQLIDPDLQGFASDIIVYNAKRQGVKINKIVQIPYSGNSLSTAVSERFGTPLVPGRKGKAIPGAWNHPIIIEEKVPSFTTGEASSFVFNGLEKGDTIYLVDDVVAHGYTSCLVIGEFRKRGIDVAGMAIYFAKLFQPGLEHIKKETGINPFFVVGVKSITKEGEITLSPPQF